MLFFEYSSKLSSPYDSFTYHNIITKYALTVALQAAMPGRSSERANALGSWLSLCQPHLRLCQLSQPECSSTSNLLLFLLLLLSTYFRLSYSRLYKGQKNKSPIRYTSLLEKNNGNLSVFQGSHLLICSIRATKRLRSPPTPKVRSCRFPRGPDSSHKGRRYLLRGLVSSLRLDGR